MLPGLGISLFIIGLVFVVLVWVALRFFSPHTTAVAQSGTNSFSFPEFSKSDEAMIILQPGGRVEYVSPLARTYFNMHENEPYDLERLARRVRPTDDFLDLCVNPGHKRVSISGRLVEISSFEMPGAYPMILLALRGKEFGSVLEQGNGASEEILSVVTEFSQNIAANLDLKTTVQSILENVSRLVPSEMLELNLLNAESHLLASYRFQHEDLGSKVVLAESSQFGSFTNQLVEQHAPILTADARSKSELAANGDLSPVQSYLGIPLMAGGELVGTLEAGQTGDGTFGQHDLELLLLVSGQAAVAIRNARLYEDEQRRVSELAGLANLNQTLGNIRDMKDLFARLVESVAPLFGTEIIGFLIYDEEKRTLEGKIPFRGLPSHFVQMYRATVVEDSPAEQVISSQQPVLTLSASTDEDWHKLGLSDIATAASLRDVALIPLLSSGRMLGYLQIGHHQRGSSPFTLEELRLMNIVASQAAAIIENILLVQQARARAKRSDALRRIASLAGSSAKLEEILKYSVQELVNLFQADAGAIFLMDEVRGELRLCPESTFGIPEEVDTSFTRIFVDDPNYRYTVSGNKKPFVSGRLGTDRNVLSIYRPFASAFRIESIIIVPLVVRDRSVGELMLGSLKTDYFNSYDLQAVGTAAGQLAAAVESADLLTQTDDSLRRRVDELSAITRLNRELSASLDVRHLLKVVHDESLHITLADCGSIFLLNQEYDSEDPKVEIFIGCEEPRELSSIELDVLKNKEPRIIGDSSQRNAPLSHDRVRSALIAPIAFQARVIGLINLHSNQMGFFTQEKSELVQTLMIQAGIALNNAQRYQVEKKRADLMRRRADTLVRLADVSYDLGHDQPLDQSLQVIARGIRDSTPFLVVLISMVEADSDLLRRVTAIGIPQEALNELQSRKQPLQTLVQLMKPEFKISRSYFIPSSQSPINEADVPVIASDSLVSAPQNPNLWNVNDTLLVPLENAEGQIVGLISLDNPSNGMRPDKATIETVEVFAAQAALLVNNTLRQGELRSRIDALSSGLQRQQKLIDSTQNNLPILLHKDLEQTISLYNLDQRTQRVRAGLAITKSVSRQLDASSALFALGRETLTQLGMSIALVAENTADGSRLLHVLGSLPRSTNVESLFGQRNPLRACLQSGEPILISNLDENEEWHDASLLTSLRAKSVICLPVQVENKTVAAMLAISPEAMPPFTDEDQKVYLQISQQASLILQNISLLNQTRRRLDEVNLLLDFSRQLSGMDPDAILKSLLDSSRRVLQHAHAGVALVWDPQTEMLTPRAASGYADNNSMMLIKYRPGEALPGTVFVNKTARRVDEINFVRDYNLSTENQAIYRQATGGRLPVSSLLVPINTAEQSLGLLVLDNFNQTGAFLVEDEVLLLSLTQQIALSLDNVRLVQDTQERAAQLHALNNAAASLTSSLSSGQMINSLLDQLVPILPYDTATLWLRDKDRLSVASARGFEDTEKRLGLSVYVQDSALFKEMAQSGQPIFIHDVREDPRFPPVENPRLSWLGIPMISKGELTGVLAAEKWQANYYTREQIQVGLTFASQSAVSLDNARLYEDSVSRATELDQRSQRLTTLNRFASALTGLLDTDQILNLTATELLKGLSAHRVSVVTFERGQAYWKASAPRTRAKLPRLLPDSPIFHRLRESQSIFNTDDARNEPDLAPLTEMLGEHLAALLIMPLSSGQSLNVLVFIQMTGENRFGLNELEIARTITSQATVALENARLYQSSVRTAERFAILNETSSQISALNPEDVYAAVHRAAERLMPSDAFVITLLDAERNEVDAVYLFDRGKRYPAESVPFGQGMSSQVIQSGKPILTSSLEQANELDSVPAGEEAVDLRTKSIVAVPMILGGRTLGMLSVQSYQADVYTEEDVQILGTLANQAIVAIQNGRLFAETQNLASQLEIRVVERTAQLQREQQNTETLLRILQEVSSSLDLDRALNRTLSLLNEAVGAEQGTIMLLQAEDNLLHYRAGYGYLTDRSDPSGRSFTLRVGEGLAGWVVQHREAVLSHDLHQDPRWVRSTRSGQDHRSAIVVPMQVGEDVIGVLMVFQREANSFSVEMLNLVRAIGSQVAVAINNAHLYELIRDQAERLGVMLRKEQEDASRSQAILEAVADGVLVTGTDNRITFVNSSTEHILSIEGSKMIGNSLEQFGGLFGKSATTWMDTIRRWSEDTTSHQPGDMYAEQLELENERIALVHLAPVILQNDFLGTVSIFRDITREVEVDRLKSEFVATVSHELRTPMTAIKGYVDILTMGAAGALTENQLHFLDIVRNNIDRLNILVNDLLDISRIESGRVTLTPQSVNLREIAEEVIAETLRRSQQENKPMALSLDAPPKMFPVIGDGERIRQIMGNLVDNAFNYTPSNGTIRINIHQQNGEMQVDVQDNGVGISPEDQARIFERFFRGEHPLVLATPGTGLGLPIVRQLVEMHKGRIWMSSSGVPGEGSTFSFTLPISK
ncbi:Alkaline phosphatase synthesis sensor protein PhoR [Anaerolineales bacterium]|nr:Alkaline phosphatase synthesis sensor protein PhoR [Anaerolineales bacterium]